MREAAIVRKIIRAVREKYPMAYVRKLADRFTRGLPDVLLVFKTKVVFAEEYHGTLFVEVKTKDGERSKIQEKEAVEIMDAGAKYLVARDAASVLAKMAEMSAIGQCGCGGEIINGACQDCKESWEETQRH